MSNAIPAFVLALVGGAAGALAVHLIESRGTPGASGEVAAAGAPGDLAERLDRIDEALARLGAHNVVLAGRGADDGAGTGLGAEAQERLVSLIEERVGRTMEARWDQLQAQAGSADDSGSMGRRAKRRLPLADVARELSLSASEEAELRQIYADAEEKFLKILAEPDGDVEEVRRELESAQGDTRMQGPLIMKYLPKVLPKIGDIMAIEMEKEARVSTALGAERAARLDDYDIIEANPINLGATVGVEARSDR